MKSPFVDQSRNETGQAEFSIHQLSENDLLDLHYLITSELARIKRYAGLLDDEIRDTYLQNNNTALQNSMEAKANRQELIKHLKKLSDHFHRQRNRLWTITTGIERINEKARAIAQDECPPDKMIFQSSINEDM